jgi:hypothetical protein
MQRPTHPHVTIIDQYLAGHLSVEAAAHQIIATEAAPLNMDMGPSLRPLLAELHRLRTGRNPPSTPPYAPDPNRHAGGGLRLLMNYSAETWALISMPPLSTLELRLDCNLRAETKAAAERLAQWFSAQGTYNVDLENPAEAESDDWRVHVTTPARRWDLPSLKEWEALLRRAPLGNDASYGGLGVCQA